jgi:hypothetical protein
VVHRAQDDQIVRIKGIARLLQFGDIEAFSRNKPRIPWSALAHPWNRLALGCGGGFLTTDFTDKEGFHGWGKAAAA